MRTRDGAAVPHQLRHQVQYGTVKYSTVHYHTRYHPQTQKRCEDEYQKDCRIEFSLVAENITQEVCEDPLVVEDCGEDDISNSILDGDDEDLECHMEYETECVREKEQIEVNALNLFSEIRNALMLRWRMTVRSARRWRRRCVRRSPAATPPPAPATQFLDRSHSFNLHVY